MGPDPLWTPEVGKSQGSGCQAKISALVVRLAKARTHGHQGFDLCMGIDR
jgi:hypothetical protein